VKSSSIISIFIALVLIVSGYVLCAKARNSAPSDAAIDGNTLVNEDGMVVTEISLEGQTFSAVNVYAEGCKVEIHGNAEKSSITLINFNENTYIAAASEKVLTVSNKVSLLDYLNFNGTGVKFSGVWKTLRSFLNYDTSKGEQEIHVYLAGDADISKINLSCTQNANMRVTDINKDCDIAVSTSDSSLEMSTIVANSLTLAGSGGEITLGDATLTSFEYLSSAAKFTASGVVAENLTVDTDSSDVSLHNSDFRNVSVDLAEGSLILSTKYDRSNYFRKIEITEGEIIQNGEPIGQKDVSAEELADKLPGNMSIKVKVGGVDITFGSEILEPLEDPNAPETPETPENKK